MKLGKCLPLNTSGDTRFDGSSIASLWRRPTKVEDFLSRRPSTCSSDFRFLRKTSSTLSLLVAMLNPMILLDFIRHATSLHDESHQISDSVYLPQIDAKAVLTFDAINAFHYSKKEMDSRTLEECLLVLKKECEDVLREFSYVEMTSVPTPSKALPISDNCSAQPLEARSNFLKVLGNTAAVRSRVTSLNRTNHSAGVPGMLDAECAECLSFIEYAENKMTDLILPVWQHYRRECMGKLESRLKSTDFELDEIIDSGLHFVLNASSSNLDHTPFNCIEEGRKRQVSASDVRQYACLSRPAVSWLSRGGSKDDIYLPINVSTYVTEEPAVDNVGGQVITEASPMYVLSLLMMIGLRTALDTSSYISTLRNCTEKSAKSPDNFKNPTTNADESHHGNVYDTFCPIGNIRQFTILNPLCIPPAKIHFTDLSPEIFKWIRETSGISYTEYRDSVCCTDFSYINFASNSKSGQFFFFSWNGKFLIKTLSRVEVKRISKLLPHYAQHLRMNPSSLLCRIFGLHRIDFEDAPRSTESQSPTTSVVSRSSPNLLQKKELSKPNIGSGDNNFYHPPYPPTCRYEDEEKENSLNQIGGYPGNASSFNSHQSRRFMCTTPDVIPCPEHHAEPLFRSSENHMSQNTVEDAVAGQRRKYVLCSGGGCASPRRRRKRKIKLRRKSYAQPCSETHWSCGGYTDDAVCGNCGSTLSRTFSDACSGDTCCHGEVGNLKDNFSSFYSKTAWCGGNSRHCDFQSIAPPLDSASLPTASITRNCPCSAADSSSDSNVKGRCQTRGQYETQFERRKGQASRHYHNNELLINGEMCKRFVKEPIHAASVDSDSKPCPNVEVVHDRAQRRSFTPRKLRLLKTLNVDRGGSSSRHPLTARDKVLSVGWQMGSDNGKPYDVNQRNSFSLGHTLNRSAMQIRKNFRSRERGKCKVRESYVVATELFPWESSQPATLNSDRGRLPNSDGQRVFRLRTDVAGSADPCYSGKSDRFASREALSRNTMATMPSQDVFNQRDFRSPPNCRQGLFTNLPPTKEENFQDHFFPMDKFSSQTTAHEDSFFRSNTPLDYMGERNIKSQGSSELNFEIGPEYHTTTEDINRFALEQQDSSSPTRRSQVNFAKRLPGKTVRILSKPQDSPSSLFSPAVIPEADENNYAEERRESEFIPPPRRPKKASFPRCAYFMVLGTVFDSKLGVHEMYDLKGSTVSRTAAPFDRVKKDNDWVEMNRRLNLTPDDIKRFTEIHRADCSFLASQKIFDYSILVGVHQRSAEQKSECELPPEFRLSFVPSNYQAHSKTSEEEINSDDQMDVSVDDTPKSPAGPVAAYPKESLLFLSPKETNTDEHRVNEYRLVDNNPSNSTVATTTQDLTPKVLDKLLSHSSSNRKPLTGCVGGVNKQNVAEGEKGTLGVSDTPLKKAHFDAAEKLFHAATFGPTTIHSAVAHSANTPVHSLKEECCGEALNSVKKGRKHKLDANLTSHREIQSFECNGTKNEILTVGSADRPSLFGSESPITKQKVLPISGTRKCKLSEGGGGNKSHFRAAVDDNDCQSTKLNVRGSFEKLKGHGSKPGAIKRFCRPIHQKLDVSNMTAEEKATHLRTRACIRRRRHCSMKPIRRPQAATVAADECTCRSASHKQLHNEGDSKSSRNSSDFAYFSEGSGQSSHEESNKVKLGKEPQVPCISSANIFCSKQECCEADSSRTMIFAQSKNETDFEASPCIKKQVSLSHPHEAEITLQQDTDSASQYFSFADGEYDNCRTSTIGSVRTALYASRDESFSKGFNVHHTLQTAPVDVAPHEYSTNYRKESDSFTSQKAASNFLQLSPQRNHPSRSSGLETSTPYIMAGAASFRKVSGGSFYQTFSNERLGITQNDGRSEISGPISHLNNSKRIGFGEPFFSEDGSELYFVGIIDFVTPYNAKRWLHTAWKFTKSGGPFAGEISPMPPKYYANRQIKFVEMTVMPPCDTFPSEDEREELEPTSLKT